MKLTKKQIESIINLHAGLYHFWQAWEDILPIGDDLLVFFTDLYTDEELYPDPYLLFAGLQYDPNETKAWIVGQDPYPNGEGVGYAFAIKEDVNEPKSFKVLKQAFAKHDILLDRTLLPWKIAYINSVNIMPVVRPGQPNSFPNLKKLIAKLIATHQKQYGVPVFAFGNVAYEALKEAGVEAIKIMHPAARGLSIDNYDVSPIADFIKQNTIFREIDKTPEEIYKELTFSYDAQTVIMEDYAYTINGKNFLISKIHEGDEEE